MHATDEDSVYFISSTSKKIKKWLIQDSISPVYLG